MNKFCFIALVMFAGTVAAQGAGRGPGGQAPQPGAQSQSQPQTQSRQMPHAQMHESQQMQQMQAQIAAMRALMMQMRNTQDPAERQRLLREHMQSMQQGMTMMGHMMMPGAGPTAQCAENDEQCRLREMSAHTMMLEQRLSMMQQMMEQLMGQLQAQQGGGDSKQK